MDNSSSSLDLSPVWTDVVERISLGQLRKGSLEELATKKDKVRWLLRNLYEAEKGIHEFYRTLGTGHFAHLYRSYQRCMHYCDEKLEYDSKKQGSFSQSPPGPIIFRTSRRKRTPSPSFTSVEAQCATKTFVNIIKSYCEIRLKLIDCYKQFAIILTDKRPKPLPVEKMNLKKTVRTMWKNQVEPLIKECAQLSDPCRRKLNLINSLECEVFCLYRITEFDEMITQLDFQQCIVCLGEVDNRLDSWEKEVAQTKYEGIETYKIFDWLQKHLQKCRSKMYLYFSDFLSDMVCKDKYFLNKLNILDQGEFSFFLLYEEEKTEEEFFGGFSYMAPCLQNDKTDAEDSTSSIEKFTILYSSTPSDKIRISKYELCTLASEVHQATDDVYKTFRFNPIVPYIMKVDSKTTAFLCVPEERVSKMVDDNFSDAFRNFVLDLRLPFSFNI